MDKLVLKQSTKSMLQNLAKLYVQQKVGPVARQPETSPDGKPVARPWSADYIEDKGKGLVVLLHGKPGVGKTYTAECIAHTMQRPLLSITCADIGVDPPTVETRLRKWFTIARLWDAVLLLDEADIYFESRQTQDLARNNLVASFLRAIEYYDGILFLTTNRIGTSDEAVWSRIHATIYYDNFNDTDRRKIWDTYFDKLEVERENEIRVLESAKDYVRHSQEVQDLQWNGREIRNGTYGRVGAGKDIPLTPAAFQIAVNLAQAEGSRDKQGRFLVKMDHIKVTVDLLKDFSGYMEGLHKMSQSKRARVNKTRDDDFTTAGDQQTDAY